MSTAENTHYQFSSREIMCLRLFEEHRWSAAPQVNGGWVIETSDSNGDDEQEREIARTRGSLADALWKAVQHELPQAANAIGIAYRHDQQVARENDDTPAPWMSLPLSDSILSNRSVNALLDHQWHNIKTLGDVDRLTDAELHRIPNLGRISWKEIRLVIGYYRAANSTGVPLDAYVDLSQRFYAMIRPLRTLILADFQEETAARKHFGLDQDAREAQALLAIFSSVEASNRLWQAINARSVADKQPASPFAVIA